MVFDDWAAPGVSEDIKRLKEDGLLPPINHGGIGKKLVFGLEGMTLPVRMTIQAIPHSVAIVPT